MDADEPDVFAATADEFAVWAEQAAGAAGGDPEEARLLLGLIGDYLSITDLAGLRPADLRALLLDIYPRKITVLNREDTAGTMVTARALLRFMEETGRAASVAELQSELDEIEPGFADAVMDPARWGLARSVMHAMASDGVDIGDESAVDRWIAIHNARQQLGLLGDEDPFDDGDFYGGDSDDSDDDLGDAIGEGFGLQPGRAASLPGPGRWRCGPTGGS